MTLSSGREQRSELRGRRRVELIEPAVARRLVGPPPQEVRGVAEALALQVVVGDLGDEAELERLPAQIFVAVPPAAEPLRGALRIGAFVFQPARPRVFLARAVAVRLQLGEQLGAPGAGERSADAHRLELA